MLVDQQPPAVRGWMRDQLERGGVGPVVWHDGDLQELAALAPRVVALDLDAADVLLADLLSEPSVANRIFVGNIPIASRLSDSERCANTKVFRPGAEVREATRVLRP